MRVFLTGRLTVTSEQGGFDETALPGGQGRLTFAALAHHRNPIARDDLAEILWDGDLLPDQWSGALNSIISKIRGLLGQIGLDPKRTLTQTAGSYQLIFPTETWIDAEDAVRRLDRAAGALRHDDIRRAVSEATVASGIYRRPFLAGTEGTWVETVRARHRDSLYRADEILATGWIELGDPDLAAICARHAIATDPFREIAYRLLMEAEAARGDRGAALQAFDDCQRMLAEHLDVTPSRATMDARHRIAAN